jgi:RimJ/RimL family protein N-acetyltransferase
VEPLEASLRDGTRILIRPIRPDDRQRLEDGFTRLSPRSRYLRFHSSIERLSEAQVRYFTEVDHHDHVALAAIDLDTEDEPGIGVARYVRLRDEPEVAEAAVTVLDEYQGRGLGTLLLRLLAEEATRHGVRVFRNYVLAENTVMLKVFKELGAVRELDESGVYTVDLAIPLESKNLPQTPAGRVFKAAARHLLPKLDARLPPVWQRAEDETEGNEDASQPEDAPRSWSERGNLRHWLDEVLGDE